MKFAKELERELVPEWRLKYLDYKVRWEMAEPVHTRRIADPKGRRARSDSRPSAVPCAMRNQHHVFVDAAPASLWLPSTRLPSTPT